MKRVWLVDDSALALETVRQQLGAEYAIETFSDGSAVLERAASGRLPDVLLLDWIMPGVSGSEVLRFLRAEPRTQSLPILVLTATATGPDLVEALDAGANDYVARPCTRAELVARVGALLRGSELLLRAEAAERENKALLARERAARGEAEAANLVKDDFLATLSHELRTPLHSILGWTALLRAGTLSPETEARALSIIERAGKAQATIIEDLLDISRIVRGKLRIELTDLDPTDAIEQAVETVRPIATTKKVELRTRLARVGMISGDAARLQQIAWNLLTNAVRYTPAGGTVTIGLEAAGHGVQLSVADTGEGIAPGLLARVFDRFKQGDSSTTRTHGGLGLGLAIVRHLTELHGGTVRATSDGPGCGARFEVWLPLAAAASDEPSGERGVPPTSLEGVRVLVVDDDADSLEVVSTALSTAGAQIVASPSAREALRIVDASVPDVVVSDLMMPEMDGHSFVRALRERPADRGGRVPAIALSAAIRDADRSDALANGFQRHLSKPVDVSMLVAEVGRLARGETAGS